MSICNVMYILICIIRYKNIVYLYFIKYIHLHNIVIFNSNILYYI